MALFLLFVLASENYDISVILKQTSHFLPGLQSLCSFIKCFYYDEPSIELEELHHVIQASQPQQVGGTGQNTVLAPVSSNSN